MKNLIFLLFLASLVSCTKSQFKQLDPAFIVVDGIDVLRSNSNPEPLHAIEDLWVFVDEIYLGTFPVPIDIPVLNEGTGKRIKIFPGIREFGIRSRPEIYTLMEPYTLQTELDPGEYYSIKPMFKYKQNISSSFFEDFENGNLFSMDLDQDKSNHITRTSLDAQDGRFSGMILNDAQHTLTEIATSGIKISPAAFLELSFKSSQDFNIGVQLISGAQPVKNYFLVLKASAVWKKIYIPFREVIDSNPDKVYQLIIKSEYTVDPKNPMTTQTVLLDQFKIISLP